MLKSQKLEIRSVEIRGKLAELSGIEETLTEEQRTELKDKTLELRDVESQRVAALEIEALEERKPSANGTSPDPEERERRAVLGKARLGNAIRAVIDGRPLQGAEAEVRSAFGLAGDHEVPHELFEPRAATPAPTTTPINEQPVQPYLYKETVAGYLGIDMHQAGSGTPSFPVLSTGTPAGMKAKGAAADETAGAFTVVSSTPKRITGAFRVRVEDMAVFPQLEDSLRRDIPQSLANAVEEQLLNGDGQAPNIKGILKRLDRSGCPGRQEYGSHLCEHDCRGSGWNPWLHPEGSPRSRREGHLPSDGRGILRQDGSLGSLLSRLEYGRGEDD